MVTFTSTTSHIIHHCIMRKLYFGHRIFKFPLGMYWVGTRVTVDGCLVSIWTCFVSGKCLKIITEMFGKL